MSKRTVFASIVGMPNVGKSTLLNALVGEKVAIVSAKPQTTRSRITGIVTKGEVQYVFLDTPGLHKPRTKLGEYMVRAASGSIGEGDAVLFVVEPMAQPRPIELEIAERLRENGQPTFLVINKIDEAGPEQTAKAIESYAKLMDFTAVIPVSAKTGDGVSYVEEELEKVSAESEWYFPEDMYTDQPERQLAAEIIREKMLYCLEDEVPHGIAVEIESFEERDNGVVAISAVVVCEKDSHKGIIIGKHGTMLKKIGSMARTDLESFLGCRVFLEIFVKVKDNWRDNGRLLVNYGYDVKEL